MKKKRMIIITGIILSIVVISLSILKIYDTYALSSYVDSASGATYNILVNEENIITIPSNSYKDVFYMVLNTNSGAVKYNVAYTKNDNVTVKYYDSIGEPAFGEIGEKERKYVKLRITNTASTAQNITLSSVLGYLNGGDLIIPNNITLVNKIYQIPLSQYITNLYTNAEKEVVTNNSIEYNYATSVSLMNDRLGGTTEDYDAGNIRYYGASPNNYIYFNCSDYSNQSSSTCEKWRIIGVFDGKVKLMRNEKIGTYSWDNKDTTTGAETDYGSNDWTTARLMKLLNPSDYYTIDTNDNGYGQSLYYNGESGKCFVSQNNATADCDFTSTGLKNDTTRNMISEETYSLKGYNKSSVYSNTMYKYERTTGSVYSGRPTSWTGKIALAYPSDYGYAVDFNQCNVKLYYYNSKECIENSWLILNNISSEHFLTSNSNYPNMIYTLSNTNRIAHNTYSYTNKAVYPTLHLNPDIEISNIGDGSSDNPYRISI